MCFDSCSGDPPTPPDPRLTAGLQTATNVNTALAGAFLNNMNQVTPTGSLTYDVTGSHSFTDPSDGQVYQIPSFTQTQSLTPAEQNIQNLNATARTNLGQLAADQSGRLGTILGQNFDPLAQAPAAGNTGMLNTPDPSTTFGAAGQQQHTFADAGAQQTGFANAGAQQTGFGPAGEITRSYGPADNFSADRARVEEALYGRLNPQLTRERQNIEQRLADQGIRYGSEAYRAAMDDYNRQANDLRLGVTQTAGTEQARMMDMAARRAGFENAAQQQAYEQALGRGTFANAAQAQLYQQALGRGTFANTAQAQAVQEALARGTFANAAQQQDVAQAATRGQFANAALAQQFAQQQARLNAQNAARSQYLTEQYAARGRPINEITALMSGSQVSQPSFGGTPTNQIPTTDIASLINQNFGQNLDIFRQQSTNQNALLGGVLGLGGNIIRSDRRAKDDVVRMGSVFAAGDDGERERLPIYEYSYRDDPASTRHVGPMAQDVEKIDRGAVHDIGGVKHIEPHRVMGAILRAA